MFFGSKEAKKQLRYLKNKPSYEMDEDKRTVEITRGKYNLLKNIYSENPSIQYKIYHYINNYLSEPDVVLISDAINDWLNNYGSSDFTKPNISNPKANGNTIRCTVIFKFLPYKNGLNEENIYVIDEDKPLTEVLLETIDFIDEDTKEYLGSMDIFISVKSASAEQIELIKKEIANKTKSSEETKNKRMTAESKELYDLIMNRFAKVLKNAINEAFDSNDD